MKIQVIEIGTTLIDADPEYQEPVVRAALEAGGDVADTIIDYTDSERSNISGDEYAIVHEDDGTVLWQGWLTGDQAAETPVQALDYLASLPSRVLRIFSLRRNDAEYDEAEGMIVIAGFEGEARRYAAASHAAEGEDTWYRPDIKVSDIGQAGNQSAGVVLVSLYS